jgi:hypothetical protein
LRQAIIATSERTRFATPTRAVSGFAEVATILLTETQRCATPLSKPSPSCVGAGQGAAIAQSASTLAGHCPGDEIDRMRASLRTFLVALERPIPDMGALPPVPNLPTCT